MQWNYTAEQNYQLNRGFKKIQIKFDLIIMKPSKTYPIMKTIKTIWLQSGRIYAMELLSIPEQNYQPNFGFDIKCYQMIMILR